MLIRKPFLVFTFLIILFLDGCVMMEVGRQVQSGRIALLLSNPKGALPHFQAAARLNPDYITDFTLLDVGIWTYVGRSYYEMGEREKALESLRRARKLHSSDYIGSLYLGVLMAQMGKREEGKAELEGGLKGLGNWLANVPVQNIGGQYWDPGFRLAKVISQTLTMLQAREINWTEVVASVEWLGYEFEEEIDEARLQERDEGEDESSSSPGL